ncbi:MAG TPA: hypothetical protein VHU81_11515 [Thermoanaerobaculia bacterium]|jgi:hypothetical protein|nr:hypothetical protein [Thermoanaerobaculia bacterium]
MARSAIPGYDLELPREIDVIHSLMRMLGPEKGLETWRAVCRESGIRDPESRLSLDQLSEVARELSRQPGLVSVIGRTLSIRLNSYRALDRERRIEDGEFYR